VFLADGGQIRLRFLAVEFSAVNFVVLIELVNFGDF
jgi:hypothetical protein